MKNDIVLGKKSLRFYYFRYKDSPYYSLVLLGLIIIVCLVLIFQLILPQMERWFSLREEAVALQQKIALIKGNVNYMKNVDKGLIDRQLQLSTAALPSEKEFSSVMNAIATSARTSGMALEDYSFQVGKLSSESGNSVPKPGNDVPSMTVTVSLRGDFVKLQRFLAALHKKLPLAEVWDINGNKDVVSMDIQFYYHSFPQIYYRDDEKIVPLSDTERELLNELSGWQVSSAVQEVNTSGVAIPLF